jgi:uncharacterized membrane protein
MSNLAPQLPSSSKFFRELRTGFITGIAVLLPLAVTVFLVHMLVTKVGAPAGQFIFRNLFDNFPEPQSPGWYVVNLMATITVFILITGVGFFSRYFFGKLILRMGERVIEAVPLVNTIYKTVKQIVDTFSKQQKAIFQKVMLVQFPKEGTYVIAFLTSEGKGEVQHRTGKEVLNVFVPTTPNPTSGFLLMVPRDEMIELEMTVAEGMKLIISGGAVSPPFPRPEAQPKGRKPSIRVQRKEAHDQQEQSIADAPEEPSPLPILGVNAELPPEHEEKQPAAKPKP